jgi:hypothetical protein
MRGAFAPRRRGREYDVDYDSKMERVTSTIDEETIAAIRRVAGPRGVSSFLQLAAKERLARLGVLKMLDDLDAKHGKPSPTVRADVATKARRLFRR